MRKILLIAAIAVPLLMFAEEKTVGYLGVSTENLSEAMKIALDLDYGLLVKKVHEDSPAEKADIKTGDIILEIDGDEITDYKTLKNLVEARPNDKVKIRMYRSNKSITKDIELGERTRTTASIDFDIPDFKSLKELWGQGSKELKEELEKLKEEVKQLREDLEDLKKKTR